ncbi:MAG: signal recognition particle-docking protein FtsY [Alphaproteobacteria bacterium]
MVDENEKAEKKAEKKSGGFFKKMFGGKSKDEQIAEDAAQLAAQQKLVDDQMAARMAAINAAALKSAREQDAGTSSGQETETEDNADEMARIEAEERERAEAQARKDVEAAKALAIEKKRQAEELAVKHAAEAKAAQEKAELDTRRAAEEKAALEKARKEQGEREAAALKAKQEAEAKARAAFEAKERADLERIAAEKIAADKAAADKYAIEKAAREKEALEQIAKEKAAADLAAARKAREEKKARDAAQPDPADGFLERVSTGLRKSTSRMSDNMAAVFTKRKLDEQAVEDLEDLLVASDLGVGPAMKVTALLSKDRFDKEVTDMEIKIALADVISDILTPLEKPIILGENKPQIMLFVGVNGSGKTTTLGKIAKRYTDEGKKVLIVAGDTFRAAAVEQLSVWGERSGAPVMSGNLGADAAGLVYDAIDRARNEAFDIVMIDTAGRLQNRSELMDELSKIVRVIKKQDETAPHHCVLVLDATVGQNALSQTEAFKETAGVTGIIMTKLDGTAKGGVLVALSDKYKLPIHAIGIGEKVEDLESFSAPVFAAALSGIADAVL